MRSLPALGALLLLAAQVAFAQDAKPLACEDEKQVQDLVAACATLVEKAEGKPFPKSPAVHIAKRDEVARILKSELAPQMKVVAAGKSPEECKDILDSTAECYALVFLCKYSWQEKAICVVPENFRFMSATLQNPKLLDAEMLRTMILHELVHAHDDAVVDLRPGSQRCRASASRPRRARQARTPFTRARTTSKILATASRCGRRNRATAGPGRDPRRISSPTS